jgi:hypothetical protein
LNKRTNTPPIVKNQPDFNIVNSTSNINNWVYVLFLI